MIPVLVFIIAHFVFHVSLGWALFAAVVAFVLTD